jgi:phosphatidylserine decarboxylase
MVTSLFLGVVLALATMLPLAWKWKLGVRRSAAFVLVVSLLAGLIVDAAVAGRPIDAWVRLVLAWLITLGAVVAFLAYRFYRDPERTPPDRADVFVSPTDGKVLYIRRSRAGLLPVSTKHGYDYPLWELTKTPLKSADAVVVGIALNLLDVHVNRAPIAGRVRLRRHFPGRFGSLRRPEMEFENERATTVIEREGLEVAVVQIASRLVRQIVSMVEEGQVVALGQRIAVIRLGSQVDLVLPDRPELRVTVRPGDRVRAGETVIAEFLPGPVPVVAGGRDGARR